MLPVRNICLKDCIPMPEVNRQYYNHFDYLNLKHLIEEDGFDRAYPIRVIKNKEKNVFEVFDGIHRMQIMKEIGLYTTIPAIDETSFLTRPNAVAKGIKANQFRAPYNPMDLAKALQSLGKTIAKNKGSVTKHFTVSVCEVAETMRMSQPKVSQLLQLLKLPKEVQDLIGEGKLKFTHARPLMTLIETDYEKEIISIASDAAKKGSSVRDLWARVGAVKSGKIYDTIICGVCHKSHPRFTMKHDVCPDCIVKNNDCEPEPFSVPEIIREKNVYKRYLDFVTKRYGEKIPVDITKKLQDLHKIYPDGDKRDEMKWNHEAFLNAHPEEKELD
jgi:ParB/RepB/Spo0J family partition protein